MNFPHSSQPVEEPAGFPADNKIVIPVIREEAQVHTVLEHIGTVRVRKAVHETTPTIGAGYREVVEAVRVAVNQVVPAVKAPWYQGDVLVIPVYEEQLVKQLVLLEEIHITRRREAAGDGATALPVLRREEVIVERLDPETGQWVPKVR